MHVTLARVVLGALFALLPSCVEPPRTPWPNTPFPKSPTLNHNETELGRMLFYDPVLSSDRETACATCHSEVWGMSDALARSVGHGAGLLAGPGRKGPHVVRRNSPALWNLAFRNTFNWDGGATSLESQVATPLAATDELNLPIAEAAKRIGNIEAYQTLFQSVYEEPVSVARIKQALAAFQRTMVSKKSLYDAYARGEDGAMDENMVNGMHVFADLGCDSCHTPPLFESEKFERRGIGDVGPHDYGRFEVTGDERDLGAFRVPTLRNTIESNPYFHDGSVAALADAVAHEVQQSGHTITPAALDDLVYFIERGLVDRSQQPLRPTAVPSGLPLPIDGTTVLR